MKNGWLKVVMALLLVSAVFMFTACSSSGGRSVNDIGRYQVFSSTASNLIDGVDPGGYSQVYVRDMKTGEVTLVSVGIDGNPANGSCDTGTQRGSISADGRYVVFDSDATNLVDMEFQGTHQVYVRDLQEGVTTLVSMGDSGEEMGDNCAKEGRISADGKYIVYSSNSSNILGGVAAASRRQIFRYEMSTGTTTLVSVDYAGNPGTACSKWPSISADGRYVAFESKAANLVEGVGNGYFQIYVRDMQSGSTVLASVGFDGNPADGGACTSYIGAQRASISADGRYVVFDSPSYNLVEMEEDPGDSQVYVRDLQTGVTTLVSKGDDGAYGDYCNKDASISADGRYIVYSSSSSNILGGVAATSLRQIFLYDQVAGTTTLVSVGYDGNPGNSCSRVPLISADGRYVTFESKATNLVNGVDGGYFQVYVRDMVNGATSIVSVNASGVAGDAESYVWEI